MARGDQIYVMRELMNLQGVYEHHGIDYGDGTVIHYRKGTEIVSRTSMAVFSDNRPVYIQQYRVCYIPDVVIQRAESRLGEQQYNLLFNNCEHFATWCKTGVSESRQVKDFVPLLENLKVEGLAGPIAEALRNRQDATQVLAKALTDIKVVWDGFLPQYDRARKDYEEWDQVARHALEKGREDLAKAAIQKKLTAKKQATYFKTQLDQLATMTETLTRNHRDLQIQL